MNTDGDSEGDACDLDDDNDGWADSLETPCGADPLNSVSRPERVDGPFATTDDDQDGFVDELLPGSSATIDCDGDGFAGSTEAHVYASFQGDQRACGSSPAGGWPADFVASGVPDSTQRVNILDVTSFVAPMRHINTNIGANPGNQRWDIVPGKGLLTYEINVQDLTQLLVIYPRMLGGARAFGGPDCPWP